MSRKLPNASEMGKKGGNKLKEMKQGTDYYAQIRLKGQEALLKRDPDFYKKFAAKGYHARQVKLQTQIAEQLGDANALDKLAKAIFGG